MLKAPGSFRPRKRVLVMAVLGCVGFFAAAVVSTVVLYQNSDGSIANPELAALISFVVWMVLALLCSWYIAVYYRQRLFLSPEHLILRGVIRERTIRIEDVTRVEWAPLPSPGYWFFIQTKSLRLNIYLRMFTTEDGSEIAAFIRNNVPEEKQSNWPYFVALGPYAKNTVVKQKP